MGKSMQEVIHENHVRANKEYIERCKKYKKQQEKKHMAIFCIVMAIFGALMIASIIISKNDLDRCKATYNAEYCELGL